MEMPYSALVRDAWALTWRNRYLWIFGLLAGGTCGNPGGGGGDSNSSPGGAGQAPGGADAGDLPAQVGDAARGIGRWAEENPGAVVALVGLGALLLLALVALSFVSQGAIARAGADLATGQPSSLGAAWAAGRRLFWRNVGLALLLLILFGVAALVGVLAVLVARSGPSGGAAAALVLLVGLPLGLALLVVGNIVSVYAQRAIAVEELGPVAALGAGWRLFRGNVGTSLVVWLLSVVIWIVVGLAVGAVVLVALVVLGGIGFLLWTADGLGAGTVAYAAVAGLLFVAAVLLASAVASTFLWHYWTLAYLRLTGRTPTLRTGSAA